jgi:hypothetical protein
MPLTTVELLNAETDCGTLAAVVNGGPTDPDVISRLGMPIKPLAKAIAEIGSSVDVILAARGYEPPVAYAGGINIVRASQTVVYLGQIYAPVVAAIPFVTGAFDATKWYVVLARTFLTKAQLKGVAAVNGQGAYISDGLLSGPVQFDSSNLLAACTADPLEGMLIKPLGTDGSLGAWRRVRVEAFLPEWWGGAADWNGAPYDSAGAGTDNFPVFQAILAWIAYANVNYFNFSNSSREILLSGAAYYFSDTLDWKSSTNMRGYGNGGGAGEGTRLVWAQNKAGIRGQRYNTTAENGPGAATTGSHGSTFVGLSFESLGGAPNFRRPGLWMRDRLFVHQSRFLNWPGPGLLVLADTGTADYSHGNANGWGARDLRIDNCRWGGLHAEGGDANAGYCDGIDISYCARYGLNKREFLGSGVANVETAQCGMNGAAGLNQTSVITDGSYRYRLKDGQDALAATTPPTSGVDNAVWESIGAGGVHPFFPLYSTYTGTYVSGGNGYVRGSNSRAAAVNCYGEGDCAPWIFEAPAFAVGGLVDPNDKNSTHLKADGSTFNGAVMASNTGFGYVSGDLATGQVFGSALGGMNFNPALGNRVYWTGYDSLYAPSLWRLSQGMPGGYRNGDVFLSYQALEIEYLTGPSTTEDFGTGTVQPRYRCIINFAFGDIGQARRWNMAAAAPVAGLHARGEVVWNNVPAAGGNLGWVCTVTGTPGTWVPFGIAGATQVAHQANSAAAPTMAEFNALLAKLQAAKVMA